MAVHGYHSSVDLILGFIMELCDNVTIKTVLLPLKSSLGLRWVLHGGANRDGTRGVRCYEGWRRTGWSIQGRRVFFWGSEWDGV